MRSSSLVLALLLPLLVFASITDGLRPYPAGLPEDGADGDHLHVINNSAWDNHRLLFCGAYVGDQCGSMEADRVVSLPGQPDWVTPEDFDQYAGYVTVDPESERALFYYFTSATQDIASTPLLLWINGGGNWEAHSSLGHGGMTGQGPFRVNSDGETLSFNNYSWNKVANIIFLESPAGVGYSYSNTSSDYEQIGDIEAVEDAFVFLLNWLERFPEYKTRDLYLAGDGYAGHTIPLLAHSILLSNKNCNQTFINLKGIAIGNGWMDEDIFLKGVYDYEWMHNLITDDTHDGVITNCDFSLPLMLSPPCIKFVSDAAKMMADINPYDIYGPPCLSPSSNNISGGGFDTCSHMYVESYLNLPDVQEALHANVTGLSYGWTIRSSVLKGWNNSYSTISPILKNLMASGTRVWLYSGDTDSVVPITSTKYFIDSLQLPVQCTPYPWLADGEIAGIAVTYENLTFASVRGGGHFISSFQPARALALFSSFIEDTMLSNSSN